MVLHKPSRDSRGHKDLQQALCRATFEGADSSNTKTKNLVFNTFILNSGCTRESITWGDVFKYKCLGPTPRDFALFKKKKNSPGILMCLQDWESLTYNGEKAYKQRPEIRTLGSERNVPEQIHLTEEDQQDLTTKTQPPASPL